MIRWFQTMRGGGKDLVKEMNDGRPHLGAPLQVCLKPGDCALVHPYLAHRVGTNVSPNVRYSIIFRLTHNTFEEDAQDGDGLIANPMKIYPQCAHLRFEDDEVHQDI